MRTPFWARATRAPSRDTPSTAANAPPWPRLPMLMPWPGPQSMSRMRTAKLPLEMEMQSSPVAMRQDWMVTAVESATWMPSVFGLSSGESTRTLARRTSRERDTVRCICCAFCRRRFRTLTPLHESMVKACTYICSPVNPVNLAGVGPPFGAGAVDETAALDAGAGETGEEEPQPGARRIPLRRLIWRHDSALDL
ncbi:Os02g0130250, partial [Oryza sativa Japonica Group]